MDERNEAIGRQKEGERAGSEVGFVNLVGSAFERNVNAAVVRNLEDWTERFMLHHRYAEYFAERGIHYIFKMVDTTGSDPSVCFRVEAQTIDANGLYATAKVQQLEAFPWQAHTGGETIGQVRSMLSGKGLSAEEVARFYPDYGVDDPIDVISDETAIWLRDTYGIAPWYGALNIPYSIQIMKKKGGVRTKHGHIYSGFSGCKNSQEDLFYNMSLTHGILEVFAKFWKRDVIRLNLSELRRDPIIETPLHWLGVNEVISPSEN